MLRWRRGLLALCRHERSLKAPQWFSVQDRLGDCHIPGQPAGVAHRRPYHPDVQRGRCGLSGLPRPAYHDDMVETSAHGLSRPVRWSIWLATGVVLGLVLGFAAGLTKPHERR